MVKCKTAISPVHQQWRYCSLSLSHQMFYELMIENLWKFDAPILILMVQWGKNFAHATHGMNKIMTWTDHYFTITCRKKKVSFLQEVDNDLINPLLTHFSLDKMAAISLMTFSDAFSSMKSFKISLKFVPKGPINKIPVLVQIIAWPLSEPYIYNIYIYICVTKPQWVKRVPGNIWLI